MQALPYVYVHDHDVDGLAVVMFVRVLLPAVFESLHVQCAHR